MNQYNKTIMVNHSKECKDIITKPLKIRVIQATPFISLVRKQDYKIFTVIIEDIKKVLELK